MARKRFPPPSEEAAPYSTAQQPPNTELFWRFSMNKPLVLPGVSKTPWQIKPPSIEWCSFASRITGYKEVLFGINSAPQSLHLLD